ncbi:MAG: hypothetical protein AAF670_07175 [Planctomycetota bacterium]
MLPGRYPDEEFALPLMAGGAKLAAGVCAISDVASMLPSAADGAVSPELGADLDAAGSAKAATAGELTAGSAFDDAVVLASGTPGIVNPPLGVGLDGVVGEPDGVPAAPGNEYPTVEFDGVEVGMDAYELGTLDVGALDDDGAEVGVAEVGVAADWDANAPPYPPAAPAATVVFDFKPDWYPDGVAGDG